MKQCKVFGQNQKEHEQMLETIEQEGFNVEVKRLPALGITSLIIEGENKEELDIMWEQLRYCLNLKECEATDLD